VLKDKFPIPVVPLTAVLPNLEVFLPDPLLRMSRNRARKKIFGPKREEVTMDWRRWHNGELHDLHFLSNVIRVIK
jgi:hypothetical protein